MYGALPVCMSVYPIQAWCQERALDPVELELQWLWATKRVLGMEPESSERAAGAVDCGAIYPVLI